MKQTGNTSAKQTVSLFVCFSQKVFSQKFVSIIGVGPQPWVSPTQVVNFQCAFPLVRVCVCVTSFCSTCNADLRTSRNWVSCFLSSSCTCFICREREKEKQKGRDREERRNNVWITERKKCESEINILILGFSLCADLWPVSLWKASGCPQLSDRPGRNWTRSTSESISGSAIKTTWFFRFALMHIRKSYLHCAWKYLMRFCSRSTPFLILISLTLRRYCKDWIQIQWDGVGPGSVRGRGNSSSILNIYVPFISYLHTSKWESSAFKWSIIKVKHRKDRQQHKHTKM